MDTWDTYEARINGLGSTKRDAALIREQRFVGSKAVDNLSFKPDVLIDGVRQGITVIDTDNLDTKKIRSLPGEDIPHGAVISWADNHWLVTEKDANNEVYTRATMQQCNYLLRWVDVLTGTVMERWCLVEDGTKYLTGEFGDRDYSMNRGDSRVSLTITKDDYTLRFNRESRFIIDDYDSPEPLAYRMTKPYKLGGSYGKNGVLRFVLTECNTESDDNLELHIADYYSYFPDEKPTDTAGSELMPDAIDEDRKVWI